MGKSSGSFTVKWNGPQIKGNVRDARTKALRDAGNAILNDALNLVPHDEGALSGTGNVDVDEGAGVAYISFDGPYAVRQHEDMNMRHPNGRQAKYLETPLKNRAGELLDHVAAEMKKVI